MRRTMHCCWSLSLLGLMLFATSAHAPNLLAAEAEVAVVALVDEDYREGRHLQPHDYQGEAPASPLRLVVNGPQAKLDGRLIVGPGASLTPESAEPGLSWVTLVDGKEVGLDRWTEGLSSGKHTLTAQVSGSSQGSSAAVELFLDDQPPEIVWSVGGRELGRTRGEEEAKGQSAAQVGEAAPLEWTSAEKHWLPMAHRLWRFHASKPWLMMQPHRGKQRWGVRDDGNQDRRQKREKSRLKKVRFEEPHILLRSESGAVVRVEGLSTDISAGNRLEIEARDAESRVERLEFQLVTRSGVPSRSGVAQLLVIEAVDAVGNRSRVEWPLEVVRRRG